MNILYIWFNNNLEIIYFIYGLTFIVIGTSILASQKKNSNFKIAGILWYFGVYAFLHAPSDFIKMWSILKYNNDSLITISKILELTSYLFVFEFGRRIINILKPDIKILNSFILPVIIAIVIIISIAIENFWVTLDILMGYFVRLPGGVMAGIGLRYYYISGKEVLPARVKKYFFLGGTAMLGWSVLCGIFRTKGDFFPANVLNIESFFLYVNIPVYVFRSACAIIISWSFTGIVGIFNWETQKKIENLLEMERNSKDGLEIMVKKRTEDLEMTCISLREEVDLRIKAEKAEKEASLFLQAIIDSLADSVLVIARDGSVELMNKSSKKLIEETNIMRFNINNRLSPFTDFKNIRERMTIESELINLSGEKIYIEIIATPLIMKDGSSKGIIETIRDITERRRLEKEIIGVIETERRRIGQDLHDDLAQNLIAIDVLCKMLNEKLEKRGDAGAEVNEISEIIKFVNFSITTTRRLARGLCPIEMENGGFVSAVEKMIQNIKNVFNMNINLKIDKKIALENNITATNLYQIIREAVNNIIKHSRAKNIFIDLDTDEKLLKLAIHDDGIGIPDDLDGNSGLGIRIMRYRADMIGSKLLIGKNNGKGTIIECSLELNNITSNK